jgi:hypothetical protein
MGFIWVQYSLFDITSSHKRRGRYFNLLETRGYTIGVNHTLPDLENCTDWPLPPPWLISCMIIISYTSHPDIRELSEMAVRASAWKILSF